MKYEPINSKNKQQWIDYLNNVKQDLDGQPEDKNVKNFFPNSEDGDVASIKDIVGNFLALLTDKTVEIK